MNLMCPCLALIMYLERSCLIVLHIHAAYLESVVPIVVMVLVLEMFVDSIKHAFITKFNDISPDVYKKYRTLLAMDLVTSRQPNVRNYSVI